MSFVHTIEQSTSLSENRTVSSTRTQSKYKMHGTKKKKNIYIYSIYIHTLFCSYLSLCTHLLFNATTFEQNWKLWPYFLHPRNRKKLPLQYTCNQQDIDISASTLFDIYSSVREMTHFYLGMDVHSSQRVGFSSIRFSFHICPQRTSEFLHCICIWSYFWHPVSLCIWVCACTCTCVRVWSLMCSVCEAEQRSWSLLSVQT